VRTTNEWLDWAKDEHYVSNVVVEATHSVDYDVSCLDAFEKLLNTTVNCLVCPHRLGFRI
jgi:hypothetical protein